jgi:PAS domain-containing protein
MCLARTKYSFVFAPITTQGYVNLYGQDITERKLAEQALAQANTALKEANETLQGQAEELEVQAEELQVHTEELMKAHEKLRRSEVDLARAQAVANTGNWRLDVRKDELLWSDETYRMFGVPKGTPLTYELFLAAVHPDDRDFVDRSWVAALQGEPYDIEHRISWERM